MTERRHSPSDLARALFVDEVGIETGIYGKYRLKTAHQPIFSRDGANLALFGVEARVSPLLGGRAVAPAEFFAETPQADRAFVEALCRMLHLRNQRNFGVDDPELFELYMTIDPRHDGLSGSVARMAENAGVAADMIICEIADAANLEPKALAALTRQLRSHGMRVAVAEFRIGQPAAERLTQIKPDIIKIDGAWFRDVQESSETAQLFPAVITAFKGFGAKLLVQGIETPAELEAALEAGVDYLQGALLEPPALAGSAFDERPRPIEALLRKGRKLAESGSNHHRR
jgi:EAL domain-containing protein (putative c-di-GMP-specific phosphodiesterase class I)